MRSRVALVTGGGGGIGAAVARSLAARGCRVALTYRSRQEEAQRLAAELGGEALALDLADGENIKAVAREVEDKLGAVEILVHNAGMIADSLLAFLPEKDWDQVLAVNLKGPFLLTRALIKGMLRQRWGRVISIASLSGVVGQLGQAHYSAAKGGLIAFTKALARELASYGITANSVAPGFIDTEMLKALPEKKLQQYLEEIPMKRLGRPEEVAALVAFLASEEAGYITGQTLRIDGGIVMA
ncbi:MAG TPA: 3-oxoacyl-ACP reductase FabG [Thermoanaerobaculia bacterium]|nr:3-oxoacyl-ACP reductase FabG [Thermoanaerobaculia bacterium]